MVILTGAQVSSAEEAIIGGPFAVLEHGQKGSYEWRVYTSPFDRQQKAGPPCINVSLERELRPISEAETFMACGRVAPLPIVMQSASGMGEKRVTVAGMAFDREVRLVKIPLSDGRAAMRRPRIISARTARKAHVERFAFLAFAVARGLSIGRVIGYDAQGRPVSGLPPR